jgi:hypothetical protein
MSNKWMRLKRRRGPKSPGGFTGLIGGEWGVLSREKALQTKPESWVNNGLSKWTPANEQELTYDRWETTKGNASLDVSEPSLSPTDRIGVHNTNVEQREPTEQWDGPVLLRRAPQWPYSEAQKHICCANVHVSVTGVSSLQRKPLDIMETARSLQLPHHHMSPFNSILGRLKMSTHTQGPFMSPEPNWLRVSWTPE